MAKKKSAPSKSSTGKTDGWVIVGVFVALIIVPLYLVATSTKFFEESLANSANLFVLVGYIATVLAGFLYYISKNSKSIKWTK